MMIARLKPVGVTVATVLLVTICGYGADLPITAFAQPRAMGQPYAESSRKMLAARGKDHERETALSRKQMDNASKAVTLALLGNCQKAIDYLDSAIPATDVDDGAPSRTVPRVLAERQQIVNTRCPEEPDHDKSRQLYLDVASRFQIAISECKKRIPYFLKHEIHYRRLVAAGNTTEATDYQQEIEIEYSAEKSYMREVIWCLDRMISEMRAVGWNERKILAVKEIIEQECTYLRKLPPSLQWSNR